MTSLLSGRPSLFHASGSAPVLRPYQSDVLAKILAYAQRRVRGILVQLPTGSGKTVIFTRAASIVAAEGWETWVFVHRRELLWQASRALDALGLAHGIVSPDGGMTDDLVQVASIDTVRARLERLRPRLVRVRLAILDEAHHVASNTWGMAIAAMRNAVLLGVTATAFRYDGKGLGEFFTEAVHGPSIRDLIEEGFLSPPAVFAPPAKLDLSKVRKRGGDYVEADLAKVVDTDEMTLPAVRHYAQICGGVPAIAFCASVEHAHHVAEQFSRAGWAAGAVDGGMSVRERDAAIRSLATGRLQILTSCQIINEGTDIPVVGAAILLRPTKSTGLYLQQVGRVLRPYPGKTEAIVIDQVGNVAEHGMPDEPRLWSLAGGLKGLERAVAATRRCRTCFFVAARGPDRCPRCHRKYPAPPSNTRVPDTRLAVMPGLGDLSAERIASMTLKDVLPFAKTREDLIRVAEIRGYKRSWVDHVMAERSSAPVYRRFG